MNIRGLRGRHSLGANVFHHSFEDERPPEVGLDSRRIESKRAYEVQLPVRITHVKSEGRMSPLNDHPQFDPAWANKFLVLKGAPESLAVLDRRDCLVVDGTWSAGRLGH